MSRFLAAQRQFLEATGLSPIDWVIRERVALAHELLETTDRPLHWIAEMRELLLAGIIPPASPCARASQPGRLPSPVADPLAVPQRSYWPMRVLEAKIFQTLNTPMSQG
nr:hypothetical protein [Xanthomonas cannabis]